MKNSMNTRYPMYALISLYVYVSLCYIGFSETWSPGVMKLFMAGAVFSGLLFVRFCYGCGSSKNEGRKENESYPHALAQPGC